MNYAAARHLVPSPAPTASGGALLPWESEADTASARQETWLLSFVDILALLLTLFVLLLAHQDREPPPITADIGASPRELSLSVLSLATAGPVLPPVATDATGFALPGAGLLPVAAGGAAVAPPPADRKVAQAEPPAAEPSGTGGETPAATVAQGPAEEPTRETDAPAVPLIADAEQTRPAQPPVPAVEAPPDVARNAEDLLATLRDNALAERVEVTARPGAVSLEVSDSILFTPASAALSVEGMALLNQLAGVLRTLPYTVAVEGHTDNVPIHTRQYPSNWELSAARAAMVTRKLIEQGVAAQRVRAVGYGDTRPRSDNQTPEGRAKNRRVTFVLQVESPSE